MKKGESERVRNDTLDDCMRLVEDLDIKIARLKLKLSKVMKQGIHS